MTSIDDHMSTNTTTPNPDDHRDEAAEKTKKPADQGEPLSDEEELDEALDETFPASDPIAPSRIDGPNN